MSHATLDMVLILWAAACSGTEADTIATTERFNGARS